MLHALQVALLRSAAAARDALQAQNASLSRDLARQEGAAQRAAVAEDSVASVRQDLEEAQAEAASLEAKLDAAVSELDRLRGGFAHVICDGHPCTSRHCLR